MSFLTAPAGPFATALIVLIVAVVLTLLANSRWMTRLGESRVIGIDQYREERRVVLDEMQAPRRVHALSAVQRIPLDARRLK